MILFSFFDNFGTEEKNSEGSQNGDGVFFNSFEEENENILEIPVLLLGDSGVGKTYIFCQLTDTSLELAQQPTTRLLSLEKYFRADSLTIKLILWDSPGLCKYRTVKENLICTTHLFILVYSVTDRNSWNNLGFWLKEVKEKNANAKFLLVGNKIDVSDEERKVKKEEGENFAKENGMEYVEVSAKDKTNISEDFFVPFIIEFLKNQDLIKQGINACDENKNSMDEEKTNSSFCNEYSGKNMKEKNTNSSFCDECCSCCPCFKKSED